VCSLQSKRVLNISETTVGYRAAELPLQLVSKFGFLEPKLTAKLFHLFNHFYQGINLLGVMISMVANSYVAPSWS
jgi:hypothetical protein